MAFRKNKASISNFRFKKEKEKKKKLSGISVLYMVITVPNRAAILSFVFCNFKCLWGRVFFYIFMHCMFIFFWKM